MKFTKPITTIIPRRYSCRAYLKRPIPEDLQDRLQSCMAEVHAGPLGSKVRFALIAAGEGDRQTLRGLGTYGFIRDAPGFILGAVKAGGKDLEDFGYVMEMLILLGTDLGLGTCWLGGTFTKSSFARKILVADDEVMPAAAAIGIMPDDDRSRNSRLRSHLGAANRKPWSELFFQTDFGHPLSSREAGAYTTPLEMVRLGPSASNRQPWRIVKDGNAWHFYLQRVKGYGRGSFSYNVLKLADLQRVDLGIAMCHFELTARELDLAGQWEIDESVIQSPSELERPNDLAEYIVSWKPGGQRK